ncbi:hypothetical protein [Hymenobacter gelipurpurascens]
MLAAVDSIWQNMVSKKLYVTGGTVPSDLYRFATTSDEKVSISVNGKPGAYTTRNGYAVLARKWHKNDVVEVNLPMEVRQVVASPKVQDDLGKVALQRGPVVYCAEWKDNNGKASNLIMPGATAFTSNYQPEVLNGIMQLRATSTRRASRCRQQLHQHHPSNLNAHSLLRLG